MIGPVPLCMTCARLMDLKSEGLKCQAFPEGIPDDIILGGFKHTKSYKGDIGFQYLSYEEQDKIDKQDVMKSINDILMSTRIDTKCEKPGSVTK